MTNKELIQEASKLISIKDAKEKDQIIYELINRFSRAQYLLGGILRVLPENRDWLDPFLEDKARKLLNE